MSEIAPFAPVRISIEFALTDGNQVAKATYECPPGSMPSADDIKAAAGFVKAQVQSQLGEAFVWQTRHGFVTDEMAERTGGVRLAVPGLDTWEAEWAA